MRWAGFVVGVSIVVSFVSVAQADPVVSSSSGDLPIAAAAFPTQPSSIAPAKVDLTSPAAAVPAYSPPAAPGAMPSAPQSLPAPSQMDFTPDRDGASYCVESPTVLELGVLSLVRMIEAGTGMFAVAHALGPSRDEQAFDDAAAKELRRLTFMKRLAQTHEEEAAREFGEKLSMYLRKREFALQHR